MASSGDGEQAVVGSGGVGEGNRAVEGSGGSGEGELALLHSLDYPCTSRLRLRRLLAYLRAHSYTEVYLSAKEHLGVIFHVRDLVKQVKAGQLQEAALYVRSFVRFSQSGYEARTLVLFLDDLMALNSFAKGSVMTPIFLCNWFVSIYGKPVLAKYPCFATLVADVLFMRSDHARAFLDWQLVWYKAAKIVEEMVYKTPELRDKLQYPRGQNNLYQVMPIGSRRYVKKVGRTQSTDLAQYYLEMKRRLPSSSQGESHNYSGSAWAEEETLMALLEKALQAGRRLEFKQGHPYEVFPFVQAMQAAGCRQGPGPDHSSKQAMKHFKDQGTAIAGNGSKRSRTSGNFGEVKSSSLKASHVLVNERRV